MVVQLNIQNLIIQFDSHYVVDAINRDRAVEWRHRWLIIHHLLQFVQEFKVQFVYREANNVADLLSKIGSGVVPQQDQEYPKYGFQ